MFNWKRKISINTSVAVFMLFFMPTVAMAVHDCCDYATYNKINLNNDNVYIVDYDKADQKCHGYEVVLFFGKVLKSDLSSRDPDPNTPLCTPNEVCKKSGLVKVGNYKYPRWRCFKPEEVPADVDPTCNGDLNSIRTAIGCIDTQPEAFATLAIRLGVGIGSGIAFILILMGSFRMVTSQGNPEGIAHAKETITSAIIGLLFIILSVTIIQVVGFDILGLGSLGLSGN